MKKAKTAVIYILVFLLAFVSPLQIMPVYGTVLPEGTLAGQKPSEEVLTETEEERYNEVYYENPAVYYLSGSASSKSRAADSMTLEEYIVSELEDMQTYISIEDYEVEFTIEEFKTFYWQVLYNNPQLFYVGKSFSPTCLNNDYSNNGIVCGFDAVYIETDKTEVAQMKEKLENIANEVAAQIDPSLEDWQKALIAHDYLVQHCEYDEAALSDPDIASPYIYTAYGALVDGKAVCDGYSAAYIYLMDIKFGIPCERVASGEMNHAWNMIQIGGNWYHVDATWDDPISDTIGQVRHDYFLIGTDGWKDGHYGYETNEAVSDSSFADQAFWKNISSAICYYNGAWYYTRLMLDDLDAPVKLMKKEKGELLNDSEAEVYSVPLFHTDEWGCYMRLIRISDKLYFNTAKAVFMMGEDENPAVYYDPELLDGESIYQFTIFGNEIRYRTAVSFAKSDGTDVRTHLLGGQTDTITGISAENVTGFYTGTPYQIVVSGCQQGDKILYAGEDGVYKETQPEMTEAGVYTVKYRVEREGYEAYEGEATVTILVKNQDMRLDGVYDPVHTHEEGDTTSQPTDYSYVYFGSYPQTKVIDGVTVFCEGDIEKQIRNAEYDENDDADLGKLGKYRRVYDSSRSKYVYYKWEPIKWRVLEKKDGALFLMSAYGLDTHAYHSVKENVTWETSEIRAWLNQEFYETAFTKEEQEAIREELVKNGGRSGNDTTDKIYLLSGEEVTTEGKYGFCSYGNFEGDATPVTHTRQIKPTQYVSNNVGWWLRTNSDKYVQQTMQVFTTGYRCPLGKVNTMEALCVPVLHIDTSSDTWIDELTCVKKEAKETLDTYKSSYEYMVNDWTKVQAGIASGETQIAAAAGVEAVNAALERAKQDIDGIKTYAQYQEEEWSKAQVKPTAAAIHNPTAPSANEDAAKWDYVYLGSYPQTEVDASELNLQGVTFDENGDAEIEGEKYRRYKENGYSNTYCYYKWEPIRWRVLGKKLNKKNNTLLLMADIGLDAESYAFAEDGSGWAGCGLREFLNNTFYHTAFSVEEQKAIVAREDAEQFGNVNAEEGKDKIYILSQEEAMNLSYGFINNEQSSPSRQVKSSDYARNKKYRYDVADKCWWWLRYSSNNQMIVEGDGSFGNLTMNGITRSYQGGLCLPVLHLDLESEEWAVEDSQGNPVQAVAAERLVDEDDPLAVSMSDAAKVLKAYITESELAKYDTEGQNRLKDLIETALADVKKAAAIDEVEQILSTVKDAADKIPKKETDPSDPTDPSNPTDPSEPENPNQPTNSNEPTNPSNPINQGNPVNSNQPINPEESTDLSSAALGKIITDPKTKDEFVVTSMGNGEKAPEVSFKKAGNAKKKTIVIASEIIVENVQYKVTGIAPKALKGNKKVTMIKIPATVVKIGSSAFESCRALKTVSIDKGVMFIDKSVFKNCGKLKTIMIKSRKIKKVGKNVFKGVPKDVKIKVPNAKIKAYQKLFVKSGLSKRISLVKI